MRPLLHRAGRLSAAHPSAVGVLAASALAVLAYVLLFGVPGLRGGGGQTIRAAFGPDTASAGGYELAADGQVISGAPVRVHGVDVGVVTGSVLAPNARATIVAMRIRDVVVHDDAAAQIAFRTLLGGNLQIELDPGSPSAPPLGDKAIPVSRTNDQVTVDQLLETFPAVTRQNTKAAIRGLTGGFGDPTTPANAIAALGSTTPTISAGTRPLLGSQPDDLSKLVSTAAATARALDAGPDRLRGLGDRPRPGALRHRR